MLVCLCICHMQTPHPEDIALENITETMVENITYDGLIAWLVWGSPGSELPSTAIQILVNDSLGAVTVRNISVVLCACENNGTCINATTPQYNNNGHYLQECDCPDYFSGDLCETDDRSCSDTSCPEYSVCEVNSSVPAGFTCSSCRDGYELDNDGKCVGECATFICLSFNVHFQCRNFTISLSTLQSLYLPTHTICIQSLNNFLLNNFLQTFSSLATVQKYSQYMYT